MNSNKKLYLYSGLAIVTSLVLYAIITRKKTVKGSSQPEGVRQNDDSDTIVTTTGDVVSSSQVVIPKTLLQILKGTPAQATALLKNKPIFTKIDNVKIRRENFVNNGFFNNEMSEITNSGFYLGKVIEVVNDKGNLKNPEGRVYKWFKIKPTQETLDEMNRNKDFLTSKFLPDFTKEIYVREDVVKLQ